MTLFYRLRSILTVTLKRLWAQRTITLATLVGLTMSVALLTVVPLYADAVNFRLLEERLTNQSDQRSRPPFAYMFNYIGAWKGALQWEDVAEADAYMMERGTSSLGLPRDFVLHHFETDTYEIYSAESADYSDLEQQLALLRFATTTDIENQISFVEGAWPAASRNPSDPIGVAVSQTLADTVGWQPGETYAAFNGRETGSPTFAIRIDGIWTANNEADDFWLYQPQVFDERLLIPEASYLDAIAPAIDDEVYLATWYTVLDGSQVGTAQVERIVAAVAAVERQLATLRPDASTLVAPTDALQSYRRLVRDLTTQLYAFNVPTVGLVLTFVVLVGGLTANQRRNEFAVLRSRGGTAGQLLSVALFESLILGALAFVLGTGLGLVLTQFIGSARSFMDFSAETTLRISLSRDAVLAALLAIVVATLAQMIPLTAIARDTIISYKTQQSRASRRPFWQRAWLDLLLLAVTAYGYYTLQGQGSLTVAGADGDITSNFSNPLLFLLPAFSIVSVTLLFLRLLPLVMRGLSNLLQRSNSVTLLHAVRYLARSPQQYNAPLILLILTVSFAIFTASLARTLDFFLYDQAYYEAGAEYNLISLPDQTQQAGNPFGLNSADSDFVFLPVTEYESIDNVLAASRVGEYSAEISAGTRSVRGDFMGIDRHNFADVAYWRWDFSAYRLGSLMNALGANSDGVLLPRETMRSLGLSIGDTVQMAVRLDDATLEFAPQIVGNFDLFPTWYPSNGTPLFVGNLDALFERAGSEFPYRVWLDTDAQLDERQFRRELNSRSLGGSSWREPYSAVDRALELPERQGLFGLLSVGFIAAAVLTVIGLFLYALFSYRKRVVELGVLRALGMSTGSVAGLIANELAALIVSGIVLGTGLGVAVSALFVPFLQVGSDPRDQTPPYIVEVAWGAVSQVYVLFIILFCVSLIALVVLAMRMRVFMAIKLGETV